MFYYIESLLIIILEMLCCIFFFNNFGEKKQENIRWRSCFTVLGMIVGEYILAAGFANIFLLKQTSIILFIAILMKLYYQISWGKSVVLSALFQGLLLVVDYFVLLVNLYFLRNISVREGNRPMQSYLVIVLGKVVLFLLIIVIRRYMGKDKLVVLDDVQWLKLIAFPIFTVCSIVGMIKVAGIMPDQEQENLFFIISCGLAGLNMLVFFFLNDMAKRETEIYENKIFRLKVDNQTKMYRSVSENFNKQKKKTHEYKNQIMCIATLMKKKQYDELEEYVSSISGRLEKELDFICTNHVIVDAILNSKYLEIKEKNIVFVLKINDLSGIQIRDEDIVIILANLLNNAIEACEKCELSRVIKLKFVCEDNRIILSVKNTYNDEIVYQGNEIQTTKHQNLEEHGIGINNIVETIQKYDGAYAIENNGQEFYFSIVIPLKNVRAKENRQVEKEEVVLGHI